MTWIYAVAICLTLAWLSSPTNGKPSQDLTTPDSGTSVIFIGPGGGTMGESTLLSLPELASIPDNMKPIPFQKSDGSPFSNGAVGALIDEKIMVCGGRTGYTEGGLPALSDKCYTLTDGTQWTPAPDMENKRAYAAAAKTEDGWWVTGGTNVSRVMRDAATKSTEILINGKWESGPELPIALFGHCLLKLNSKQHLLAGGATPSMGSDETKLGGTYLLEDGSYTEVVGGPILGIGAACAMLGEDAYIVGGGNPLTREMLSDVHIWSEGGWREGPKLPAPVYGASLVEHNNHLYLLGGLTSGNSYNKIIYKLDQGEWTVAANLRDSRWSFPAFVVPKDIFD